MKVRQFNYKNLNNKDSKFDIVDLEYFINSKQSKELIFKNHLIEFFAIIFAQDGTGKHCIDFKELKLSKGTVITIRKGQIHHFIVSKTIKGKLLLFTDEFLVNQVSKLQLLKSYKVFNSLIYSSKTQLNKLQFSIISELIERIEVEYFENNKIWSSDIIRSEIQILVTRLHRIKSQSTDLNFKKIHLEEFLKFQESVETYVFQSNKVNFYSKLLGSSTKRLNIITQSVLKKQAKDFINDIYLIQIKRILINSVDKSIKEIAFEVGFSEHTNFHNFFKQRTNQTPQDFRKPYL